MGRANLAGIVFLTLVTVVFFLAGCGPSPHEEALRTARRLARTGELSDTEAIQNLHTSQELLEELVRIQINANEWNLYLIRRLVNFYHRREMWPQALEQVEKLIDIQPTEPRWYLLKGQIYGEWSRIDLELVEPAIEAFNVARDIDSELHEATYYIALLKGFRLGDVRRARPLFEEVGYQIPSPAEHRSLIRRARFALGKLEFEQGNIRAARDVYESIAQMENLPRHEEFRVRRLLGIVYRVLGARDKAINDLRKAQRLYPDDPRVQEELRKLGVDP